MNNIFKSQQNLKSLFSVKISIIQLKFKIEMNHVYIIFLDFLITV